MLLQLFLLFALFASLFTLLYSLLTLLRFPANGWRQYRLWTKRGENGPVQLLKRCFRIRPTDRYGELKQLLILAGFTVRPDTYLLVKRLLLFISFSAILSALLVQRMTSLFSANEYRWFLFSFILLVLPLVWDKPILESLKKSRSQKIVGEIYKLSRQLLYYSSSNMNLHAKLTRCEPSVGILKRELKWLLREWFEDPAVALQRFKQRIGTEEGHSFVETLNAIRLNDSEHYYDLLRQRIADYKEKIELHRESRKETTSYVLFVIAGIPILNTFRVFIYPWVTEGQNLLNMLN